MKNLGVNYFSRHLNTPQRIEHSLKKELSNIGFDRRDRSRTAVREQISYPSHQESL